MIVSQTWAVPASCEGTYPLRNWFLTVDFQEVQSPGRLGLTIELSIKERPTSTHRLSGWARVFAP